MKEDNPLQEKEERKETNNSVKKKKKKKTMKHWSLFVILLT